MELIREGIYGPVARYTDAHIFVVLDTINERKRVSRKTLAAVTGVGEGSIKGMLKVLKDWKWIEVSHGGVVLTEFGRKNYLDFGIRFVDLCNESYAVGTYQQGVIVSGAADKVTNGMAQRDDAVRNGAEGASVFILREGKLILPVIWNMDEKDPEFARKVREAGMEDGDVLLLIGADSPETAKVVAAAVGLGMR